MRYKVKQFAWAGILVTVFFSSALPQTSRREAKDSGDRSGVITGSVSIEGKPAPGLRVLLIPFDDNPSAPRHILSTNSVTDDSGRYRLSAVPAGTYTLTVAGAAYVFPEARRSPLQGKVVTIRSGETVTDIDLALKHGGVITGRVLDADGQPVVAARVSAQVLDETGRKRPVILQDQPSETDDRGVYRLYGLPAGQYVVSLVPRRRPSVITGPDIYPHVTYHPGVTDEAQATAVEVKSGGEVDDVDIALGRHTTTYNVYGRVVNAETGSPIPNVAGTYAESTRGRRPNPDAEFTTDANGDFHIERMQPGSYVAFSIPDKNSEVYSDVTPFEVTGGDVRGLEIKVRRGSTISGEVLVEGVNDPAVLSQLARVTIYAIQAGEPSTRASAQTTIAPDSTFRLAGVRPGHASLLLYSYPKLDFSLKRIERNGVELAGGVTVAERESVSGVRLVLTYGKGSIRGRVNLRNGTLPESAHIRLAVTPVGSPAKVIRAATVEAGEGFILTDVPAGDYELSVHVMIPAVGGARPGFVGPVKQTVAVKNGTEAEVSFVLDMEPVR